MHLAGRTLASLESVAEEIRSAGGLAETAQVDALDNRAVDERAAAVAAEAGGIDISERPTALIRHAMRHDCTVVAGRDMLAGQADALMSFLSRA